MDVSKETEQLACIWKTITEKCLERKIKFKFKNFREFKVWAIRNGWKIGLNITRKKKHKPYSPKNCIIVNFAKIERDAKKAADEKKALEDARLYEQGMEKVWDAIETNSKLFTDLKSKKYNRDTFIQYLKDNKNIYNYFEQSALTMYNEGRRSRFSIYDIMNEIRWDTDERDNSGTVKINHNFCPCFARLLMEVHPELKGCMKTHSTVKEEIDEASNF